MNASGLERGGRRRTAEEIAREVDLRGRVVVITGATSGLGLETARSLAISGAQLVLGVRRVEVGRVIAADIAAHTGASVRAQRLDLADCASVLEFATSIRDPVDVLIANAGVSLTPESHLPNGLDVRFAINHLGHFLLAILLHDRLAVRGARLVVLSSAAHKGSPVRLDDLQRTRRDRADGVAYAESKTANILFAQEASRRWAADAIFANAVLPGTVMTGLQRHHGDPLKRQIGFIRPDGSLDPMVRTIGEGAATIVWAATAPELAQRGGLVLEDCALARPIDASTHPWSGYDASVTGSEAAQALWERSCELVGRLADVQCMPGFSA